MATDPTFCNSVIRNALKYQNLKMLLAIPLKKNILFFSMLTAFITKLVLTVLKDKEGQFFLCGPCDWHLLLLLSRIPFTPLLITETLRKLRNWNFWETTPLSVSVTILQLENTYQFMFRACNVGLKQSEHHIPIATMVGLDLPQDLIRTFEKKIM